MKLGRGLAAGVLAGVVALFPLGTAGAAPAKSRVCSNQPVRECPTPGHYNNSWGQNPEDVVYNADETGGFTVTWAGSYVQPQPGGEPVWFTTYVWFTNTSDVPFNFRCPAASTEREWIWRGGRDIGYVTASSDSCTQNANEGWKLAPGQSFRFGATFNSVPWIRDMVSLEVWLDHLPNPNGPPPKPLRVSGRNGLTAFVNPYVIYSGT
jgi:hypothetical protein